ncbi:MAG: hypothetical protein J6E46_06720, partial [Faecalicoccus sp.]|nr:hypothetical protein [Faecalicoccus sp.]
QTIFPGFPQPHPDKLLNMPAFFSPLKQRTKYICNLQYNNLNVFSTNFMIHSTGISLKKGFRPFIIES